jgi:hypothetical protein
VDWEIKYTLDQKHSLVGVLAPGFTNGWVPDRLQDNIDSGYAPYYFYPNGGAALAEIIEKAISTPKSLIDNDREPRQANSHR